MRSGEIHELNAFLESILKNLGSAVIAVDQDLAVQAWNRRAEELWGLRADEVRGKHFFNLDTGLPVEPLKQPMRQVLAEKETPPTEIPAVNRRGRAILCRITFAPLTSVDRRPRGVIMMMEERAVT
jgi:two-component system CheB/CheR fusion protein